MFRFYGLPEDIVSDRGTQFTSRVWSSLFKCLNVNVSLSSGYHSQSNGQTERLNQELGRFLRSYCSVNQADWSRFLPWAEYAQNSLTSSSTGITPFQCVLGFQPPLFPWSGETTTVPAVDDWLKRSEEVWQAAHVRLQRAVRGQKIQADRRRREAPIYQPGQRFWLSTKNIKLRLPCKKLSPRFIGPFPVLKQINAVSYRLQLPLHYQISPTFHVSLLKPAATVSDLDSSDTSRVSVAPPPPLLLDDGLAYAVRALLRSHRRRGQLQYLVDWEGYGPEEQSWVPPRDVLDPALIADFHRSHPASLTPRGRGRPRGSLGVGFRSRPWRGGGTVTPEPSAAVNWLPRSASPEY